MIRYTASCPRCKYKTTFTPTKIISGEIYECLHCKLKLKIEKMGVAPKGKKEVEQAIITNPLVTNGVEIESYLIRNYEIIDGGFVQPVTEVIEPGEIFTDDETIGNEYNSPIFDEINEGLFLIKSGLRKYRKFCEKKGDYQIGLFGTWLEHSAGTHLHIALDREEGISKNEAIPLMMYLHDYLPFIIALCANSVVLPEGIENKPTLNSNASNRMVKYGATHCKSIEKKELKLGKSDHWAEIDYNYFRKEKPPTIEIRVADSNIPEFVIAAVTIIRILTNAYLKGKHSPNNLFFSNYKTSKNNAAINGVQASLYWNNKNIKFEDYIDKFFDTFREELEVEGPNDEILDIFRLAKIGWNNAVIMRESIEYIKRIYSPKKYNWRRQFLLRYINAISSLLDGKTIEKYAELLEVKFPDTSNVKLGKKF